MPSRKAILAAATLLSVFPIGPVAAAFAQSERTLTEAPAQTGPVSVTFDRAEAKYAIGEVVGMFIQSAEDAYVTVLNVSPSGSVIKLFPNKYQTESFVAAGKRVQVPDPASGARLQVSGPVGKEQIKVFYSSKPLTIFADLGSGGGGMFRSIDGGMEEVARSVDAARSLGAKISSTTLTLTTVDSLPDPAGPPVAALPAVTPKPAEQTATLVEPQKPAAADKPKLAPKPKKKVVEKPKRPAPTVAQVKRKPKTYKIVTHLAPGQVLADDELELLGRVPDNTLPASSLRPYKPQSGYMQQTDMSQMQMPQMQMPQMPQMQMPQMQMPQMQMPQMQMPQIQLPGGMQLQMPQIQMPQLQLGRSAEAPSAKTTSVAEATLPACVQMLDSLNSAVSAKDIATAAAKADAIAVSADCGQFQVVAQRRIAALRLSAAQELMTADRPMSDYEPLLLAANGPQVLWQASATLGEVYFSERRFADAAADFQQAIEIIKNETRTPKAPPAETIDGLIQRAAQARILAANPSADNPQGTFVPVEKDHRSGMLGGIYSQDVRGIVPVSIPVPITFDFDQSTFTQVGTDAAKELVEAIKEQKPGRIVLIGHTDRRGGDDYNQKLSVRRAQAVADFLKENGIDAAIEAEGRGAADPLDVSAVANLTDDDIDALNRRVEWRRE